MFKKLFYIFPLLVSLLTNQAYSSDGAPADPDEARKSKDSAVVVYETFPGRPEHSFMVRSTRKFYDLAYNSYAFFENPDHIETFEAILSRHLSSARDYLDTAYAALSYIREGFSGFKEGTIKKNEHYTPYYQAFVSFILERFAAPEPYREFTVSTQDYALLLNASRLASDEYPYFDELFSKFYDGVIEDHTSFTFQNSGVLFLQLPSQIKKKLLASAPVNIELVKKIVVLKAVTSLSSPMTFLAESTDESAVATFASVFIHVTLDEAAEAAFAYTSRGSQKDIEATREALKLALMLKYYESAEKLTHCLAKCFGIDTDTHPDRFYELACVFPILLESSDRDDVELKIVLDRTVSQYLFTTEDFINAATCMIDSTETNFYHLPHIESHIEFSRYLLGKYVCHYPDDEVQFNIFHENYLLCPIYLDLKVRLDALDARLGTQQ